MTPSSACRRFTTTTVLLPIERINVARKAAWLLESSGKAEL